MKCGILFDLDGTLWDSAAAVVESWNEVLSKYEDAVRPASLAWMKHLMGKTMVEIENEFLDYLPAGRRHELMEECMLHENEYISRHGGVLMEGIPEVLAALKKEYHLSVVSNCQEGYVPAFFQAHDMGRFFDDYEEFGRTGHGKADNIRLVIERNMLDLAVYVGDTMGDYQAASAAGIPFIHAAYGFGEVPENLPVIEHLQELPAVVKTVFEKAVSGSPDKSNG